MKTQAIASIDNVNRALIFVLSLLGLLMDGYQASDLFCTVALIVWLWISVWTRMETKLLARVTAK